MKELLKSFLSLSTDIETFTNIILKKEFKECSEEEIVNILDANINYDQILIAYLILFFINKNKFVNLANDYTLFLNNIVYESNINLNKDIIFYKSKKNTLSFSIDNIYFIINNNNSICKIELPTNIKNKDLFCLNCNHSMHFNNEVSLDSYEFYVLINE